MASRPTVRIRRYRRSDRDHLLRCMVELQDDMVELDPWGFVSRAAGFEARYSSWLLRKSKANHGFVLVAEQKGVPVGVVAAWTPRLSEIERLQRRPSRIGYISDLVVLKGYRSRGIGTKLLREAEARLQAGGCDTVGLGTFYPNVRARRLYRRLGYARRGLWQERRIGRLPRTWAQAIKTASALGRPRVTTSSLWRGRASKRERIPRPRR